MHVVLFGQLGVVVAVELGIDLSVPLAELPHAFRTSVRRVVTGREIDATIRRPATVLLLSRSLVESGLLSPKLGNAVREVYSVCCPAIHDEKVSAAQVAFVRDVGP